MTVSKITTQEKAREFMHKTWTSDEPILGKAAMKQVILEFAAEFADSLTAELQKENARLREALQFIHDTFKKSEDDGYSSRDRQFAIDIAGAALSKEKE